jgi:hypothetical protein
MFWRLLEYAILHHANISRSRSSTCILLTSRTPSCVISIGLVHTMRCAPFPRVLYTARMPTTGALSSNIQSKAYNRMTTHRDKYFYAIDKRARVDEG